MVLMVYECGRYVVMAIGRRNGSDENVTVRRERAQHKAACMRTRMTRAWHMGMSG
jgi:hypothetical protein